MPSGASLEVTDLGVSFGGSEVFSGVSFAVEPGACACVVGASGSGKSTLLRAVAGLAEAEGEVVLDGLCKEKVGPTAWRARCSLVPGAGVAPQLPGGSPRRLFARACTFAGNRLRTTGEEAELVVAAASLGLDAAALDQPFGQLSAGQAQRAALAVCLALRPQVLLLDEPTSQLDEANAWRVEQALLRSGLTLLVVTHDSAQPARLGAARVIRFPPGSALEHEDHDVAAV